LLKNFIHWLKANNTLLVNAGSLVGTTAITSGLGFVYWWMAARQFPPKAVGLASATVSAMMLLGSLGILGLGTLLVGELPRQQGKEASLISAALITVAGVGGCLGIVFTIVAPYLSSDLQVLRTSIGNIAIFMIGVSLTSSTIVLDQALIGLLKGKLQLWRNALFAGAKLAALFIASLWLSHVTGLTIYATWVIGNVFSLVVLAGFAIAKREPGKSYLPQFGLLQKLGPQALKHHLLNLTLQAPPLILPVLVTTLLSATANAWFYIPWTITSIANVISSSLTVVLYAVSSTQPAVLARKLRLTLSLALVATILANCVYLFGSYQVLELFGHSYTEQAIWSLRILGLESFPFLIKNHYVAICRIQGRMIYASLTTIAGGIFELSSSALGAHLGGLAGLSLGWFIAICIEAMFMSRTVYRAVLPKDTSSQVLTKQPVSISYR